MEMILCFLLGLAIGSILTAPARRKRFKTDIQEEIEIEALKRKAEGLNRKGDEKTEIEPFSEGVFKPREVSPRSVFTEQKLSS